MQKLSENFKVLQNQARDWVEDNGYSGILGPFPNRTCWNCNPEHGYFKEATYPIECIDCGHIYFKGEKITQR